MKLQVISMNERTNERLAFPRVNCFNGTNKRRFWYVSADWLQIMEGYNGGVSVLFVAKSAVRLNSPNLFVAQVERVFV